ncbi:MOB kinase activator 1B [Entophlyctis luteolus]|nr:MOB kinase activator 1B [Entophlyctis luteolus]KAJ3378625.1 MOB kinase activator 1B [Entophlyctis sp. JEL0112]
MSSINSRAQSQAPPPKAQHHLLVPESILQQAVMLPSGEDLNEWLAANLTDFYSQLNLLYGSITQFCTPDSCPTMSAGPKFDFLWNDTTIFKKPVKLSAPEYIDTLLTSVQTLLDDESVFPTKPATPFPKHFGATAKTVFKRLFRVYAHMWHAHAHALAELDEEAHFWTSFRHFVLFARQFSLVDRKDMACMDGIVDF